MFLVKYRRLGMDKYVFTQVDPRSEGYKGDVIEDVTLKYNEEKIHLWLDGEPCPDPQLGRDRRNPKLFKVFKFPNELNEAGFEFVHNNAPFVAYSWSDYRKRYDPVPEEYVKRMTRDEWFDFLDEVDSAARLRNTLSEFQKRERPGLGSGREQIAEWVAKRHMGIDGGIQEVWFLNSGSPADEIRLLEVNDRFAGDSSNIEPLDLSLDIDGAKYKLMVADISARQLETIKADPVKALPRDWKFDEPRVWGRRELSA